MVVTRHRALAAVAALLVLGSMAALPFQPDRGRSLILVVVSWAVIVAVLLGLRRSPPGLRTQWWLLILVMVIDALTNTALLTPDSEPVRALSPYASGLASVLLLVAAFGLIMRRGRYDLGGIIDAAIVGVALAGLLWHAIFVPRMQAENQPALALVIFVLCGTFGALVRLLENGAGRIRALHILLVALAFSLAGVIVLGVRPGSTGRAVGIELYIAAYAALAIVCVDPTTARMAEPSPLRPETLSPGRLTFLGLAVAAPAVTAGIRAMRGEPVDGLILILAAVIITPLVMVRIGLLGAERTRTEKALIHMATHDPLTSVANRREFTAQLQAEMLLPRDCALLFCDLDGFKRVNDDRGHAAGDRLLVEVAQRLRESIREHDVVGRFGGDEFLILLRGSDHTDLDAVRRRLAEAFKRPFADGVIIGATIGAVVSHPHERGPRAAEDLIQRADAAMYARKPQA